MPAKLKLKQVRIKLKRVLDPDIARALSHPVRGHIIARLGEVGVLSASLAARELGVQASDLHYHFEDLRTKGLITRVRSRKRRGFTEHLYKLADPVIYIDDREWKRIPEEVRKYFSIDLLKSVFDEMVAAVNAGTINEERSHTSRVWVVADEQGQDEVMTFEKRVLEERMALGRRIEGRARRSGGPTVPVTLVSMCFRRPAGGSEDDRTAAA